MRTGTRGEYLAFHRECFAAPGWKTSFDSVHRLVGPDHAAVTTKSLYEAVDYGQPVRNRSWVTFTFRKDAAAWRLVHDENTRLPPGED